MASLLGCMLRSARLLSFEQTLKDSLDFDGDGFRQNPGLYEPPADLALDLGIDTVGVAAVTAAMSPALDLAGYGVDRAPVQTRPFNRNTVTKPVVIGLLAFCNRNIWLGCYGLKGVRSPYFIAFVTVFRFGSPFER
jgi:hypothetical protein